MTTYATPNSNYMTVRILPESEPLTPERINKSDIHPYAKELNEKMVALMEFAYEQERENGPCSVIPHGASSLMLCYPSCNMTNGDRPQVFEVSKGSDAWLVFMLHLLEIKFRSTYSCMYNEDVQEMSETNQEILKILDDFPTNSEEHCYLMSGVNYAIKALID